MARYSEIKRNPKKVRRAGRGSMFALDAEVKVFRTKGHYSAQVCLRRDKRVYSTGSGWQHGHRCGGFAQGNTPTRAIAAAFRKMGGEIETRWKKRASSRTTDTLRSSYK